MIRIVRSLRISIVNFNMNFVVVWIFIVLLISFREFDYEVGSEFRCKVRIHRGRTRIRKIKQPLSACCIARSRLEVRSSTSSTILCRKIAPSCRVVRLVTQFRAPLANRSFVRDNSVLGIYSGHDKLPWTTKVTSMYSSSVWRGF